MECKIYCWNARGEISRMAVSMELHGYHGMVRSRFSRDPAPPAGRSAVRFRPWDCQAPPWSPGDAAPSRPSTLRPSAAMLAAQRAILHGALRALALGPGRSRQRATPRHVERAWPCALRCHHRSTHLHHRRAFRALGHSPCCRPGGGVEAQRGPAVARRPPRGCAAPGAPASARLAPWKRYIYATFLGGDPRSTNLRARRSTALLPPLLPLLRATSASDANELLHFHSTATATPRPSSAGWTAPRCCGCGATSARSSRRGGAIRTAWQVEDTGPSTAARGAPSWSASPRRSTPCRRPCATPARSCGSASRSCARPSWPRARTSQSACSSRPAPDLLSQAQSEPLRSRLDPMDREWRGSCAQGTTLASIRLRERKFHRQNPLELETPKPGGFLAKRPSDLGLDWSAQDDFLLSDFGLAGRWVRKNPPGFETP